MDTTLKVALCEDTKKDIDLLLKYIKQSGISAICDTYSSCEEFLHNFLAGKYDLIFLDIYMEGINGIDAATKVRQTDSSVMLVFTTTSLDHTLESYRLKAPIYIEKPVTFEETREALKMALEKRKAAGHITLLINGMYKDVSLDRVLYFETKNHTVNVIGLSETMCTSQSIKLSYIESLLPDTFFRCHHSYIVNIKYVCGIDKEFKIFTMQNGDKVHIRHQLFKRSIQVYENFLFSKTKEAII